MLQLCRLLRTPSNVGSNVGEDTDGIEEVKGFALPAGLLDGEADAESAADDQPESDKGAAVTDAEQSDATDAESGSEGDQSEATGDQSEAAGDQSAAETDQSEAKADQSEAEADQSKAEGGQSEADDDDSGNNDAADTEEDSTAAAQSADDHQVEEEGEEESAEGDEEVRCIWKTRELHTAGIRLCYSQEIWKHMAMATSHTG